MTRQSWRRATSRLVLLAVGLGMGCSDARDDADATRYWVDEIRQADADAGPDATLNVPIIRINEVAPAGDPEDWFELFNPGAVAYDLTSHTYSDGGNQALFEPGTIVAPGEYLLVSITAFGLGSDEELRLNDPAGALIDSIDWEADAAPAGTSLARLPDGTGDFVQTSNPTPGAANAPSE